MYYQIKKLAGHVVNRRFMLACGGLALLFILPITFGSGKNNKGEFTAIKRVIEAHKNNNAFFDSFYRGRRVNGEFALTSVARLNSRAAYKITLEQGGLFGSSGRVECVISDQRLFGEVSSWQSGNSFTGRLVMVRGIISDVVDNNLVLDDQKIKAVGGYPDEISRRSEVPCD